MHTILVGINHKSADVATRELLYFPKEGFGDTLSLINRKKHLNGAVIVSTCNRVEIYSTTSSPEKGYEDIMDFICEYHNISRDRFQDKVYKCHCEKAVEHLFYVVSSLDSMVIGETQIQGQVRDAYELAMEHNSTNSLLNKLFQTAILIGKRTRSESNISDGKLSIATAGVELIKRNFGMDHPFKVVVIGAGEMAELTALHLKESGNSEITICNRSEESGRTLAERFEGKYHPFSDRYSLLEKADIVIASTGAKEYILTVDEVRALQSRRGKDLLIMIDLSMPRNIDPEIETVDNTILYSIDDLEGVVTENLKKREEKVATVESMIETLSRDYYDWYARQTIIPVMKGIRERFDGLGEKLIKNNRSRLSTMDDQQLETVKYMMETYSDKIIKIMMQNLRAITNAKELGKIADTLKRSFTMDGEGNGDVHPSSLDHPHHGTHPDHPHSMERK
jgi:glutamyl-tRNA reductase